MWALALGDGRMNGRELMVLDDEVVWDQQKNGDA
tara:strand:- start:3752 stop:3853 length:102 start_codon:yes stop_codon:yes gene_type:complete